MSLLIPLAIALAVLVAFAVLVVSLTSAPWPVLLLLIVLVLISSQRLLSALNPAENQPVTPEPDPQAEPRLEAEPTLTYRGTPYKYAPMSFGNTRDVDEIQYTGKYRGLPWKSPRHKETSR